MASVKQELTQDSLKAMLHYDPETGIFTRLQATAHRIKVGDVAGCVGSHGYITFVVNSKRYLAHRLAWFYVYGKFPSKDIDHVNGIKTDNRLCNLRAATRSENLKNKGITIQNTSGFKGVSWAKANQKWLAKCDVNGVQKNLGYFQTPEAASKVYNDFAKANHGDFYRATV